MGAMTAKPMAGESRTMVLVTALASACVLSGKPSAITRLEMTAVSVHGDRNQYRSELGHLSNVRVVVSQLTGRT